MRPLLAALLLSVGCAPAPEQAPPAPEQIAADVVHAWLVGRFDSAEQAAADPRYLAIELTACAVELPALGSRVLYLEQAVRGRPPYRQRIYAIAADPAAPSQRAISHIFELDDPSRAVGLCDGEGALSEVVERAGCEVILARSDAGLFAGGTVGTDCPSRLAGARYATTEVTLGDGILDSWDRGFDEAGRQVWGAEAGPYHFVRR